MASSVLPVPALPTIVTSRTSSLRRRSIEKDCSLLRGRMPHTPSFGILMSGTYACFAALYLPTALCCTFVRSRRTTNSFGGGVQPQRVGADAQVRVLGHEDGRERLLAILDVERRGQDVVVGRVAVAHLRRQLPLADDDAD